MKKSKQKLRGFTLIELMVTLVIATIVITIGMPALRATIQNNRSNGISHELISTLSLARSEAIKRGQSVSICSAGNTSFTACGGNSDWSNGWIVFVNPDENSTFSNNATEPLLKAHEALKTGTTLTVSPSTSFITYNSAGFAGAGAVNAAFTITANGCSADNIRTITISPTGRITLARTACP